MPFYEVYVQQTSRMGVQTTAEHTLAQVLLLQHRITAGAGHRIKQQMAPADLYWVASHKWESRCSIWWLSHAPKSLPNTPGQTSNHFKRLPLTTTVHEQEEARDTDVFETPCNNNVRASQRRASVATSLSRGQRERGGEKKRHLCEAKFVCLHVEHCVREKREKKKVETESKKTLIQRASVRSLRLSITLDSQGPFRMAANHGAALPARRLEARDKPTAELHPVCPFGNARCPVLIGPQWPLFTPGGSCLSKHFKPSSQMAHGFSDIRKAEPDFQKSVVSFTVFICQQYSKRTESQVSHLTKVPKWISNKLCHELDLPEWLNPSESERINRTRPAFNNHSAFYVRNKTKISTVFSWSPLQLLHIWYVK